MPYETAKIYGPYLRPDGRQHIIAVYPDGSRKTTSYPKYLMEVHLGRYLLPTETVDHIDRDFTNNSISNLQVLSKETHSRLDAKRLASEVVKCQRMAILQRENAAFSKKKIVVERCVDM